MKSASAATLAILAAGQYKRADLYQFTLQGGTVLRYTSSDAPLTVAGNTYLTGLTIKRGAISQKIGLEAQPFEFTMTPQLDNPGGQIQVGGVPFVQAARLGLFDGAAFVFSKLFLSAFEDTTPGAVDWFPGYVNTATPSRSRVVFEIFSGLQKLNVAMPRNVTQTGCVHTLFDSGCTLVKASFTASTSVSGAATPISFNSGLTPADGYYDLGVVKFTSGANDGLSRTVKSFLHTGGAVTLINPLPTAPAVSDTFDIYPGCDKKQATCTSKFANLSHFRGFPYIPDPLTPYSGGVGVDPGSVDDPLIGSIPGSINFPGTYQP